MRRVRYGMLVSLDGYIEDARGSIGFFTPGPELHRHFNERELDIDTHLYGRRLYGTMVPYWSAVTDDSDVTDVELEYARNWKLAENVVFSRTLTEVSHGARLVAGDAVAEIARLKALPGKDMDVGGAGLAASLMAAGLIDEYRLYVVPVVLGGGKPFFAAGVPVPDLELAAVERFPGGVVMLRYLTRAALEGS